MYRCRVNLVAREISLFVKVADHIMLRLVYFAPIDYLNVHVALSNARKNSRIIPVKSIFLLGVPYGREVTLEPLASKDSLFRESDARMYRPSLVLLFIARTNCFFFASETRTVLFLPL